MVGGGILTHFEVASVQLFTVYAILFQGVGRRYANLVLKKADIDMSKRAGELTDEEVCTVHWMVLIKVHHSKLLMIAHILQPYLICILVHSSTRLEC